MKLKKLLLTLAFMAFTTTAQAEEKALHYGLFWSGLKVGEMDLFLKENENKYDYTVNIASKGLLKLFIKYKSSNRSQGTIKNESLIPEVYDSYWKRKKHSQKLQINFAENAVAEVSRVPENRKKHPDVPAELLNGTFDPISAAFQARSKIRELVESGAKLPAKITVPVYDAKRRFDAEIFITGYETMNVNDKDQNLLHIKLKRTPIAGFRANELKRIGDEDPDIEMFLNKDFIPVWGYGKAELGTATIKLAEEPAV